MVRRRNNMEQQVSNIVSQSGGLRERRANVALRNTSSNHLTLNSLGSFSNAEGFDSPDTNQHNYNVKVLYVSQKNKTLSSEGTVESPFQHIEHAVKYARKIKRRYKNFIICILDDAFYELEKDLILESNTTLIASDATVDGRIYMKNDNTHVTIGKHICTDKNVSELDADDIKPTLVLLDADNISYRSKTILPSEPHYTCFRVGGNAGYVSVNFGVCRMSSLNNVLDVIGTPTAASINITGNDVLSLGDNSMFNITNQINKCKIYIDLQRLLFFKTNFESCVLCFDDMGIRGHDNLVSLNCDEIRCKQASVIPINGITDINDISNENDTNGYNVNVIWNVFNDESTHDIDTINNGVHIIM